MAKPLSHSETSDAASDAMRRLEALRTDTGRRRAQLIEECRRTLDASSVALCRVSCQGEVSIVHLAGSLPDAEAIEQILACASARSDASLTRATQLSAEGKTGTMPLAACAVVAALFTETFDDNRNRWYTSTDPEAPAGVENGAYLLGSKANEFRFASLPQRIDPEADFEIAVTARWLRGNPENHYGLVWGLASGKNFFLFSVNAEGRMSTGFLHDGTGAPGNDTAAVHPDIRTATGANRLRVEKRGMRLRLFVNDALVHETDFRPFFGSGVGVAAFGGPIVASFDDLTVKGRAK